MAERRKGGNAVGRLFPVLLASMIPTALPLYRLSAQTIAAGRVLRPDATDSTPVPGVRIVLHRVGRQVQGPVDSTMSARGGRFRFRFAADTGSIYLLSARYAGVEYFSSPVHLDPERPDTAIPLVVHDTSSTAPIEVAARHIVIPRAGEEGTREVLDRVVLQNRGRVARVPRDSLGASWSGPLPAGSEGLDIGESDVSPEAIERRGDSVFLAAPIGPGEKQLSFQYHLPAVRTGTEIPVGPEGGTVNLLLEEPDASATAQGLILADTQLIGGRTFRRYTGEMPAGTVIRLRLPGPGKTATMVLGALVTTVALALGVAGWRMFRRPSGAAVSQPPPSGPDRLLDEIAALDSRYLGREAEVEAEEWARYQGDRARLKDQLETILAARGPTR
jgi:hypothetical protein